MTHDSFRDEYDNYNKIWWYRDKIFLKSMIVILEIQGDPDLLISSYFFLCQLHLGASVTVAAIM